MNSSRFALQLNTWYSCDDKTSSLLDNAMNYRRKIILIHIPHVCDDLTFNLQTFEFSNNEKTIVGYIRWIPKLISSTEIKDKKLVYVDNYQSMANIQPIPLTTKCWKLFQEKYTDEKQANYLASEDDDESDLHIATAVGTENDDEADDDDIADVTNKRKVSEEDYLNPYLGGKTAVENNGTWSVIDLNDEITNTKYPVNMPPSTDSSTVDNESVSMSVEHFFNEKVGEHKQQTLIERPNSTVNAGTADALNSKLEDEVKRLKEQIQREQSKIEQEKQSHQKLSKEKEQQLQKTNKLLEDLKQQLLNRQAQEQKLKDLIKQIKPIDYDNIESIVAQNYLFSKTKHIINHLKTKHPIDDSLMRIPTITIAEKNNVYCVSVTGLQVHHDEFKLVLKRIQILSNVTQSAKTFYQRQLNAIMKSIIQKMTKQIHSSQDWQSYTKYFQQLIQNKIQECVKLFDEYITNESKVIVEQCITDTHFQSWVHLRKQTDRYMQKKSFISEIEVLKHEAFEEFIKQHVLSQQLKFEKKPSKKSVETMNAFIDKVRKEFQTNKIYVGCDVKQLKLIPKLLQRVMLYYRCFVLQLPLYESSKELLDKIEQNNVITVATTTGSGKSSLLPALLIAEGYEKVIVTQPRRLPCTAICNRVNETMPKSRDG
ncbi:unnamed protein product, partial [Rotaria sp. Silwood1]